MDQDELSQIAEFIWRGGMDLLPDDDWAGDGFTQRNAESV